MGQELEEASHLEDYEVTAVKLQAAFRRVLAKHDLENKVEGKAEQARPNDGDQAHHRRGQDEGEVADWEHGAEGGHPGRAHATLRHVPADCLLQATMAPSACSSSPSKRR